MRQLGAVMLILFLMPVLLAGCSDDSEEVTQTGIKLSFTDCLTFGVWVYIEGEYQGTASSEEPTFFPLAPGTYELTMRSNANYEGIYVCWTDQISVTAGATTSFTYSCDGAQCEDDE